MAKLTDPYYNINDVWKTPQDGWAAIAYARYSKGQEMSRKPFSIGGSLAIFRIAVGSCKVWRVSAGMTLLALSQPALAAFPAKPGARLAREVFTDDAAAPAFGFDTDAMVANGVLKLNNSLGERATAVKHFPPSIARQSLVDVSFDWAYSGTPGSRGGLEFRDLYGRLVFALEGARAQGGGDRLDYSTVGPDSDSSSAAPSVEPVWSFVPLAVGKTYQIRFQADFAAKRISFQVKDGPRTLVERLNMPIRASGLERMVAASRDKAGGNAQSIDDLVIDGKGDAPAMILAGKTIYAFGDSIVAGHMYQRASFPDFVARQEGMLLVKRAVNGATVMPGANSIVGQLAAAPAQEPDYVLFDGGTNDAYPATLAKLGAVTAGFPSTFDTGTFAGAFENLISKIRARYPHSKLIYVAVAKLGARDATVQATLRDIELRICAKWGVATADIYPLLDTSIDADRTAYSFDSLQPGGLPATAETRGGWTDARGARRPTGTHPNLPAIEAFYAPVVERTMRKIR